MVALKRKRLCLYVLKFIMVGLHLAVLLLSKNIHILLAFELFLDQFIIHTSLIDSRCGIGVHR